MKLLQPTYIMRLPSTGKEVKYRPFNVKEEKSLLLAMQENNPKLIIQMVKDLVKICTDGEINPDTVAYYDLEYAFLQIRGKAVGEVLDLIGKCECSPEAKTEFSVSIEDVEVEGLEIKSLIEIPELGVHVQMKHPTLDSLSKELHEESSDDVFFDQLADMIDYIASKDEVFDSMTHDEKVEWVSSLTSKQQRPIAEYVSQMPRIVLRGKYTCVKCAKAHTVNVAGLKNFFV